MTLERFDTPGGVDDLSPVGKRRWSDYVRDLLQAQVDGDPQDATEPPRPQFFSQLGAGPIGPVTARPLTWGAFPKNLADEVTPDRWVIAEQRDSQDEYCEWVGARDAEGDLTRVSFTTELRCYYHLLANDDPDALVALYRKHVSEHVEERDLIRPGAGYDERNRWNLSGAMHMVQRFNTLTAAVTLVAQATITRQKGGNLVSNADDLIDCGVVADPGRNSDPLIVAAVNTLARQGQHVSLADPIGLYIDGLDTQNWETPDGSDAHACWTIERGDPGHAVRAVFEVPLGRGFGIKDIKINGRAIESPSQIAEHVNVRIAALAAATGDAAATPRDCGGPQVLGAGEGDGGLAVAEHPSIQDLMAAPATR